MPSTDTVRPSAVRVLALLAATIGVGVLLLVFFEPEVQTVDAVENALLLSATGTVSSGRVDAAHALEIPKVTLFLAATALALVANAHAVRALRAVSKRRDRDR